MAWAALVALLSGKLHGLIVALARLDLASFLIDIELVTMRVMTLKWAWCINERPDPVSRPFPVFIQ